MIFNYRIKLVITIYAKSKIKMTFHGNPKTELVSYGKVRLRGPPTND